MSESLKTTTANRNEEYDTNRPSWIDFFLGLAFAYSKRSHDSETQHGCIITDRRNRLISAGYNGFPRHVDDKALPNVRPEKYPWCFHSERNALANAKSSVEGGVAYITGQPCNECIGALWQHGVTEAYCAKRHGSHLLNEETQAQFNEFLRVTGMIVHFVEPKLDWLKQIDS